MYLPELRFIVFDVLILKSETYPVTIGNIFRGVILPTS